MSEPNHATRANTVKRWSWRAIGRFEIGKWCHARNHTTPCHTKTYVLHNFNKWSWTFLSQTSNFTYGSDCICLGILDKYFFFFFYRKVPTSPSRRMCIVQKRKKKSKQFYIGASSICHLVSSAVTWGSLYPPPHSNVPHSTVDIDAQATHAVTILLSLLLISTVRSFLGSRCTLVLIVLKLRASSKFS